MIAHLSALRPTIFGLLLTSLTGAAAPSVTFAASGLSSEKSYVCGAEGSSLEVKVTYQRGEWDLPGGGFLFQRSKANVSVNGKEAKPLREFCNNNHCVSQLGNFRYEMYPHGSADGVIEVAVLVWAKDQVSQSLRLKNCKAADQTPATAPVSN